MASIRTAKKLTPKSITKFLGINENVDGQFNLSLGEAANMINWRITPQNQLKKREGWKKIFNVTGEIRGMWCGKLNGTTYFLFCANGHLYKGNLSDGTFIDLGTLTDAPTTFIGFGSKVYLNNGHEFKSFDGTTFQNVVGYRPKVYIGTPPTGGGTVFEQINVLTGAKRQTFSANGTATVYQLAEDNINSVDFVKVNGVTKVLTTDYTVNLTLGKVTFTASPTAGQDNVEIGWTKGTGQRDLIEKCRFSMEYDGRVFLWGNPEKQNFRFWCGVVDDSVSPEYWEANAYSEEGSGQYAITDIVSQYGVQKIFLENASRYSKSNTVTIDGRSLIDYPTYEMSSEVGNVAFGQTKIVNNNPVTLYAGVRMWKSSAINEQFNQELISQKVQESLDNVSLADAVTVNWQETKEYWICIGGIVWVFNYSNNTWYKFDNINAKCFVVVNGQLYFGSNGYIAKFDKQMRTDDLQPINAVWESGFYDFEADYLTKYLNNIWVTINPATKTSVKVQVATNNEGTKETQIVYYNLATFLHVNYAHWSYSTSYNPQPKYLEVQANGFVYLKLIISNDSETDVATILGINLPARYGGKVR